VHCELDRFHYKQLLVNLLFKYLINRLSKQIIALLRTFNYFELKHRNTHKDCH